ncbi:hypothetical protein [Arcicella rigui]|uniref:Uncharacterized protein n=1 Tax=Arcicella rigui TaxID=797020 RepID=A0ABU5QCR5_9BACT|nr:hypothetical protein [Arcicella rigui]MEA5140447.1 hypothetical protein [Arcicella rigui]
MVLYFCNTSFQFVFFDGLEPRATVLYPEFSTRVLFLSGWKPDVQFFSSSGFQPDKKQQDD